MDQALPSDRSTNDLDPRSIVLRLVAQRGPVKTICPSEAARVIGGENWRDSMPVIHAATRALAREGENGQSCSRPPAPM